MKLTQFSALLLVTLGISLPVNADEVNNEVAVNPNAAHQTPTSPEAIPVNQPPEPKTTVKSTRTRETKIDNGYDYRHDGYVYPVPRVYSAPKVSPARRGTTTRDK
ncbi:MAG: hypothetical protein GQ546_04860 [Gammaproteobacteria bacterium]|nr:hypothetical protein [Gammaproteobacteria bacterium]